MKNKTVYSAAIIVATLGAILFFNAKEIPGDVSTTVPIQNTLSPVSIVLRAGEAQYVALVPENSSVYDTMKVLASTTSFTFDATYYPSLGYFIEQINGITNADGTYWTLYINNAYSTIGASQYRIRKGDTVEWKYENK
jgi:hypothetical protein